MFVSLETHCALTFLGKRWQGCHLVALSRNGQSDILWWTWGTTIVQATSSTRSLLPHTCSWVLKNVILAGFWVIISQILIELSWKKLRIYVKMESGGEKRLVLCVVLVFSPKKTLVSPLSPRQMKVNEQHWWWCRQHHSDVKCAWIRVCASKWTNRVHQLPCNGIQTF